MDSFQQRVKEIGFWAARHELLSAGAGATSKAGEKQKMQSAQTLMKLDEARRVLGALAKAGIVGDTLYARNPVGSGPVDLNAEYMSESTIIEQNLQNTPLDYQIKMSSSLAPELDVAQQAALLKQGVDGWAQLIAGRKNKGWMPGITRGEAFGMLFSIDAIRAAADAALKSL